MALIINVSWGETRIERLLDMLDTYNIKASFMISGRFVEVCPAEVKMIADRGHEIGTHGYSDALWPTATNEEEIEKDLIKSIEIIERVSGKRPTLYIPPYEEIVHYMPKMAEKHGCKVVCMTIDTKDWKGDALASEIVSRVTSQYFNGAFILAHPTEVIIQALPDLQKNAAQRGFKFTTISECIK